MAGSLPKTFYTLILDDAVLGYFSSRVDIAYFLGIDVNDEGHVIFRGKKRPMTYNMQEWGQKQEVVNDWAKNHMSATLAKEYKILRCLV